MMKSAKDSGLADSEQTSGMVTSLWVVADNIGGLIGPTLGGAVFNSPGFEWGSMVVALSMISLALLILLSFVKDKVYSRT